MGDPKYALCHITKTSSGIEAFVNKHYRQYMKIDFVHSIRCQNEEFPIAIVREPVDRFISIFNYWRYGSEIHGVAADWKPFTNDISAFICALANKSLSRAEVLHRLFIGDEHFRPQSWWLPVTAYHKTVVIKYRPNLNKSAKALFSYLGLPAIDEDVQKINYSYGKQPINLTYRERRWIEQEYMDDFLLYDCLCSKPHLFKKVIDE